MLPICGSGILSKLLTTFLHRFWSLSRPTAANAAYKRLSEKSSQIRLCTLQPGSGTEPLEFSLEIVDLESAPPFEALSYTWRGDSQIAHIRKDATMRRLQPNVTSAMYHLRLEDKQRILWIDRLCINQSHHRERAHQVTLMGEIYERAIRVILWLGEATQHTESGMFKISEFAQCQRACEDRTCPAATKIAISEFDCMALESVLCRPYFHRAWTIQEIALAKTVVVQCGRYCGLWRDFVDTSRHLRHAPPALIAPFRAELRCIWNVTRVEKGTSLLSLLSSTFRSSHYNCADDRDRVYALLSLARKEDSIAVDYDVSVADLYTNVAIDCIDIHRCLAVFTQIQQQSRSPDLPSWVPDWRIDRFEGAGSPINFSEVSEGNSRFSVTLKTTQAARYRAPDQLKLKGLIVDTVSVIVSTLPKEVNGVRPFAEWVSYVDERVSYAVTGEDICVAYFKVLSTDQGPLSNRTDKAYIDIYYPEYRRWLDISDPNERPSKGEQTLNTLRSRRGQTSMPTDYMPNALIKEIWQEIRTQYTQGRQVFHTSNAYIGLGPLEMRFGDKICLFLGGSVPYIIRPTKRRKYQLLGECYIHGIMDGEAFEKADAADILDVTLI